MPVQLLAQSQLLDERDRALIRAEEVVVELLEPQPLVDLEAAREPAHRRVALVDRDLVPALGEPQRDGQAQDAAPGDAVVHAGTALVGLVRASDTGWRASATNSPPSTARYAIG